MCLAGFFRRRITCQELKSGSEAQKQDHNAMIKPNLPTQYLRPVTIITQRNHQK
jgi:hypothetical protein